MRTETVEQLLKTAVYLGRLYPAIDPAQVVTFLSEVGLSAAKINRFNKEQANLLGGDDSKIIERRNAVKIRLNKKLELFIYEIRRAHSRTVIADYEVRLEYGSDPRYCPIKIFLPRLTEPINIYATE